MLISFILLPWLREEAPGDVGGKSGASRRIGLAFLLCALSACGGPDAGTSEPPSGGTTVEVPPPNVPAAPVGDALDERESITAAGAGCVTIGATPDDVRAACEAVRDTSITLEGMSQPALAVDVDRAATLSEIVDGRVWRITVLEPGPETADGLSVGTPASRLAEFADSRVNVGEGRYFVTAPGLCGLSFGLEGLPFGATTPTPADLREAPSTVRISRILVLGRC